jgi:phosphate transport system protein
MLEAFDQEDTRLARTMFKWDKMLDKIDEEALDLGYNCIQDYPEQARNTLLVMSMIRKLVRVGDMSMNIAEEIIFYFEAKVLKHKKKKQKEGDE